MDTGKPLTAGAPMCWSVGNKFSFRKVHFLGNTLTPVSTRMRFNHSTWLQKAQTWFLKRSNGPGFFTVAGEPQCLS